MQVFAAVAARRLQRGLSLVEAAVVLAVVAVLAGGAAPAFEGFQERRTMDGIAANVLTGLHLARSEAVARHVGVRASFMGASGGGTCMIVHTGGAHDCSCSAAHGAQCTAGATLIKSLVIGADARVGVRANVASMRFDQDNGSVTPTGTIRIETQDGRAVHHVVNIAGRVRSCSPGAAVPGLKSC